MATIFDSDVRANVCRSLGESGNVSAIPILKSLFSDKESLVRKSAFEALASFPRSETTFSLYADALQDSDGSIRSRAVERLEGLGDPAAIPLLEKVAAKDPDPQLKFLAKKALAALSPKKP